MVTIILLLVLSVALLSLIGYRLSKKEKTPSAISVTNPDGTPNFDAPLDDWQEFLSSADWETILKIENQFIPRAYNKQDNALFNMLHYHLLKTEHPILSNETIDRIKNKTIWVDDETTDDEIKKVVKKSFPKISKPVFVVRKNKELVGFAITRSLIIYGITPVCTYPENAIVKVSVWKKSFLTKEDSKILEANLNELKLMMHLVNVPNLKWASWMIQNPNNATIYDGYCLTNQNRYIYFEFDDPTPIIVKL